MKALISIACLVVVAVIVAACSAPAQKRVPASSGLDPVLLEGTIEAAQSLVFPGKDEKVAYDIVTKSVYISFVTPSTYTVNYADYYLRWRDNQWVVLQAFKEAGISVEKVTVETNHVDGSGVLRVTHSATHVDQYAKQVSDELWLRTGAFYQKGSGSDKWEKVPY